MKKKLFNTVVVTFETIKTNKTHEKKKFYNTKKIRFDRKTSKEKKDIIKIIIE